MLLSLLRDASDPENLFDWSILFSHDELFEQYVTFENVMFFFGRIHRENLIKCEMYDGLKEQYHKFIYGSEEEKKEANVEIVVPTDTKTPIAATIVPAPEIRYINEGIDEAKLIDFIRDYTDGPNKSNYFVNKSHWLAIYTVLHQKLKALGNVPIFLFNSRPKFAEWVNLKIQPQSTPVTRMPWTMLPSISAKRIATPGTSKTTINPAALRIRPTTTTRWWQIISKGT